MSISYRNVLRLSLTIDLKDLLCFLDILLMTFVWNAFVFKMWQFAPNSLHYLLSLWQRMVASMPYVKNTEPHLLESYVPEVGILFVTLFVLGTLFVLSFLHSNSLEIAVKYASSLLVGLMLIDHFICLGKEKISLDSKQWNKCKPLVIINILNNCYLYSQQSKWILLNPEHGALS